VSHPAQILLKRGMGNYWTLVASSLLHVWCTFTKYLSLFGMSNVQPHSVGIAGTPTCEFGKYTRGCPQFPISHYVVNPLRTGNSDIEKIRLSPPAQPGAPV
jgi:hypothetical protein